MTSQIVANGACEAVDLLCRENNVSRAELARELHITRSAMSQKMTGRTVFTLHQIRKIADYFGVSVDSLLGREPLEVA
ncbi:transcriptional regulator [Bifidobacterium lemurum]|uniref:Transcriptional regulator n=1 Tax=Bifidobacterium lemurum TaxID=1603886 RepID=A0A261FU00_9BIFI|nr:helix-turn-helix transcriptional regulator [Bifidobacterium lemurum]OZG62671.1 transcriptional regulator [Bifidobacterium lemurum]QOL34610.1 helix-turn-helix transcriptional regulator [Bifidobacterium lemurum]